MRFKITNILSLILFFILPQSYSAAKTISRISTGVGSDKPSKDCFIMITAPAALKEEETAAEKKNEYLEKVHFYDRKKMGTGSYLMWDDIKAAGLYSSVYDIFRTIPGLVVKNNTVFFARYSAASLDPKTNPLIYVDGMLMPNVIDNIGWLNPPDVLAIEVYNGIHAPAEYSRGTLGGVILIWTRH